AATAFKPLLEVKPHHVEKTYAITIGAFLQMVQRIAPRMPGGGRIVTISGMDTHRYVAGHGVLASAKAALEALTRYLAVELGPRRPEVLKRRTLGDRSSAVVSVIGRREKGVVARVSTYLAAANVNIEDIEERVMEGLFIMTMLVDLSDLATTLDELVFGLRAIGD